jgi:hypothetical protein
MGLYKMTFLTGFDPLKTSHKPKQAYTFTHPGSNILYSIGKESLVSSINSSEFDPSQSEKRAFI